MPFTSQAQAKWMFANKPAMAKEWASKTPSIKALPKHHSGKGTKARLNTAAEKHFFKSKVSK
jgi:hypothetical protein